MHSSSPPQSLPLSNLLPSTSSFSHPLFHQNKKSYNLHDTAHNTHTFTAIKDNTNTVHLNQEPLNVHQFQNSTSSSSQSLSHHYQSQTSDESATISSFSYPSTSFHQNQTSYNLQNTALNMYSSSQSLFPSNLLSSTSFSHLSTSFHQNQTFYNSQDTTHNTQTFNAIKTNTHTVHLNQEPPNINEHQNSASLSLQFLSHNQNPKINKSTTTSSFSCPSTLFQQSKRIYQNNTDSSSDSDLSSQNSRESEQNNVGIGIFLELPNGISEH